MRVLIGCCLLLLVAECAAPAATETPYNLGVAAYKSKNYQEAYARWSDAAKSGNTDALNNLAFLMFNGLGTDAQPEKAVQLWTTAAEQGQSESQWHLGYAYADGVGVNRDIVVAYAWYRCSIETANTHAEANAIENDIAEGARKSLIHLTDQLNGEELEQGKALAAKYIEQYADTHQGSKVK